MFPVSGKSIQIVIHALRICLKARKGRMYIQDQ